MKDVSKWSKSWRWTKVIIQKQQNKIYCLHFLLNSIIFYIRFKSLLCRRLVESGWLDEVTILCKEKLKERLSKGQSVRSITENDLFNDIAPDARSKLYFEF